MGRRENAVLLADERKLCERHDSGATEQVSVTTRRVFDEFEKQLRKMQDEGNE